jgi:SPP1 family predicted phage head-tail adaptor
MRRPTIGRLRHPLTLEAASRTSDGGGGASEAWSAVAEVWAEISPTSGTEAVDADALTGRVSHEIVFRYRSGVVPVMRLRSGTRLFEIAAVIDVEERRRWLKCLCVERDL